MQKLNKCVFVMLVSQYFEKQLTLFLSVTIYRLFHF